MPLGEVSGRVTAIRAGCAGKLSSRCSHFMAVACVPASKGHKTDASGA